MPLLTASVDNKLVFNAVKCCNFLRNIPGHMDQQLKKLLTQRQSLWSVTTASVYILNAVHRLILQTSQKQLPVICHQFIDFLLKTTL